MGFKRKIKNMQGKVISYEMTCKVGGKVVRRRFKTLEEARNEYHRLRGDAAAGRRLVTAPASMTVSQYGTQWLSTRRRRDSTIANYSSNWNNHIEPVLGQLKLSRVTRQHASDLVHCLLHGDRPLSPSTVRHVYNIARMIFREAVEDGLIAETPFRRIQLPEVEGKELVVLDRHEVQRLLAATPPEHRAVLTVAATSGLRQAELLGLAEPYVDLGAGHLCVEQQLVTPPRGGAPVLTRALKTTTSRRLVPLPSTTVELLGEHLTEVGIGEEGLLFVNAHGRPWRRGSFNEVVWKPTLHRAGLDPKLGLHVLRHSYASGLLQDGISPATVSKYLGHKHTSVTLDIYSHHVASSTQRAVDALEQRYGQQE